MATVLTLGNNKGGVGKSTSATEIAHGLVLMMRASNFSNCKVLLVDTDSQAHSTMLLTGKKFSEDELTLYDALNHYHRKYEAPDNLRNMIVQSTWDEDLHVLPASKRLEEIETSIESMDGGIFGLDDMIETIKDDYQVIIFDTCPKFSMLTKMSLIAADRYLIPVSPAPLDADGLVNLIERVELMKKQWRQSKPILGGIIVVKFSSRVNGHNEIRDEIAQGNLSKYYTGTIPLNAAVEYAQGNRESILVFEGGRSQAAQAYAAVIQKLAVSIFQKA